MIRLGSHTPFTVRLHIRAQLAAGATTRTIQHFRRTFRLRSLQSRQHVRQEATAIVTNAMSMFRRVSRFPRFPRFSRAERQPQIGEPRQGPAGPCDAPEAADLLSAFRERYEDLIGLLCGAAQDLAEPGDAEEYARLRAWFIANYGAVRPLLVGSARADAAGEDPFEALFVPATLEQAIHSDELLPHMLETRRRVEAAE